MSTFPSSFMAARPSTQVSKGLEKATSKRALAYSNYIHTQVHERCPFSNIKCDDSTMNAGYSRQPKVQWVTQNANKTKIN